MVLDQSLHLYQVVGLLDTDTTTILLLVEEEEATIHQGSITTTVAQETGLVHFHVHAHRLVDAATTMMVTMTTEGVLEGMALPLHHLQVVPVPDLSHAPAHHHLLDVQDVIQDLSQGLVLQLHLLVIVVVTFLLLHRQHQLQQQRVEKGLGQLRGQLQVICLSHVPQVRHERR